MFAMAGRKIFRFDLLTAVGLIACLFYFGWHQFLSPTGAAALERLETTKVQLELELASLRAKRMQFESRVALLRPESLDPEMLDEMARSQLGLVGQNDFIVRIKP